LGFNGVNVIVAYTRGCLSPLRLCR